VSIEQFAGTVPPELLDILDDTDPVAVTVAGSSATVVDRSMLKNPGNYELVYVFPLASGGSLIVSGTADRTEMELVAQRALESLKG
jgi:nitroimidazol reductase NimA-like FMN-containing flavoprotein (pyridoxamine 5'-phosphate oxidase superfamily)